MSRLVNIAYEGGTHGTFLCFCIDKLSELTPELAGTPFTQNNTSHGALNYSGLVHSYHPSMTHPFFTNVEEPHILITIEKDDLLYLERWATIRAGDFKIDVSQDEVHADNEVFLKHFGWADKFKKYYNLDLKKNSIPKFIMRDFYKLSFLDPAKNGFIESNTRLKNHLPNKTFCFPVSSFWDKTKFFNTLRQASQHLQLKLDLSDETVYDRFSAGLHFLNTKDRAIDVIKAIEENQDVDTSSLDVVEQAFVSAWIEKNNKYVVVPMSNQFFRSTGEILNWLQHYPEHYKAMNPNLPTFNNIPNPFHLWNLKK